MDRDIGFRGENKLFTPEKGALRAFHQGWKDEKSLATKLWSGLNNIYESKFNSKNITVPRLFGRSSLRINQENRKMLYDNALVARKSQQYKRHRNLEMTYNNDAEKIAYQTSLKQAQTMRRISWIKGGVRTVGAVAIAGYVAAEALEKGSEIINRSAATIQAMSSTEFGSGKFMDNANLASERQKQMAAITNAGLNARGLMGNEASRYHY